MAIIVEKMECSLSASVVAVMGKKCFKVYNYINVDTEDLLSCSLITVDIQTPGWRRNSV